MKILANETAERISKGAMGTILLAIALCVSPVDAASADTTPEEQAYALYQSGKVSKAIEYLIDKLGFEFVPQTRELRKASAGISLDNAAPALKVLLAQIIQNNNFITPDPELVIELLTSASEQKDPKASELLGSMLLGTAQNDADTDRAIALLEIAAQKEFPYATYLIALHYRNRRDIDQALSYLTRAAELGYPEAEHEYGLIHLGKDIENADRDLGVLLIRRAANSGFFPAIQVLGKIYLDGKLIERDADEGVRLLRLAASNGQVSAMLSLVREFIDEDGGIYNPMLAGTWVAILLAFGHVVPEVFSEKLPEILTDEQRIEARDRALEFVNLRR